MSRAGGGEHGREPRSVVYCILPRWLAATLHEPLRERFGDDPHVEVVVERRSGERRDTRERRTHPPDRPPSRRRVRNPEGRRVADRRAPGVLVDPPPLPRKARRYVDELVFLELLEPSSEQREDEDTGRLVIRIQGGERELYSLLYLRYFNRVYGYLRLVLQDRHEAEDLAQQSFLRVLERIDQYERRRQPFRAWLFTIVRRNALMHLQKHTRAEITDPADLDRHRDSACSEPQLDSLGWISDRELMLFIDRLPLAQRQVLVLRQLLDLTSAQTADVLGTTSEAVRALHSRALRTLERRLAAVGRTSATRPRTPMLAGVRQARVLRRRRFALIVP